MSCPSAEQTGEGLLDPLTLKESDLCVFHRSLPVLHHGPNDVSEAVFVLLLLHYHKLLHLTDLTQNYQLCDSVRLNKAGKPGIHCLVPAAHPLAVYSVFSLSQSETVTNQR